MTFFHTRFAPSPTGELHLGHAVHIVHVFGLAQAFGARVQMRLEDHDRQRCTEDFARRIREDLSWLGLVGPEHPWSVQSEHLKDYAHHLAILGERGLIYGCSCSRKELLARRRASGLPDLPGEVPYDGYCRDRNLKPGPGRTTRVRLELSEQTLTANDLCLGPILQEPLLQCGDFPLVDNKGCYTYQFCVVVDDLREGINLVIRGEDILPSTGRQIALLGLFGGKPPAYYHHPLLYGNQGEKLSKRYRSRSLSHLRKSGLGPEEILGKAAAAAGLTDSEDPIRPEDLGGLFQRISTSVPIPTAENQMLS